MKTSCPSLIFGTLARIFMFSSYNFLGECEKRQRASYLWQLIEDVGKYPKKKKIWYGHVLKSQLFPHSVN
jgi:hypothetical protein